MLGVALLDGNQEELEKLAVRLRERHRKKLLEKQEQMRKSWGLPPTPGQAANNVSEKLNKYLAACPVTGK